MTWKTTIPTRIDPPQGCGLCPRLVAYRGENAAAFPAFHNGPVLPWGAPDAPLVIVGLAPGLKGANRTGRPFTGDASGDLLLPALERAGFLRGNTLIGTAVTNAVACAPPQNKVVAAEIAACRPYLASAIENARVILALGSVAHGAILRALAAKPKDAQFAHGAVASIAGRALVSSYHPSRYNVQTGRITAAMLDAALEECRRALGSASADIPEAAP